MKNIINRSPINQSTFVETKYNPLISRVIQPVRIIGLISLLPWFQKSDMLSDPSVMFFYCFIFIYLGSFFAELVLTTSTPNRLRKGIMPLYIKFTQLLPVEFAGIASFAMLSFAPHTSANFLLAIEVSTVMLICWLGIEGYHKFIVPRLNKIILTPVQSVLVIVALTVGLFFFALYSLSLSPHPL